MICEKAQIKTAPVGEQVLNMTVPVQVNRMNLP